MVLLLNYKKKSLLKNAYSSKKNNKNLLIYYQYRTCPKQDAVCTNSTKGEKSFFSFVPHLITKLTEHSFALSQIYFKNAFINLLLGVLQSNSKYTE